MIPEYEPEFEARIAAALSEHDEPPLPRAVLRQIAADALHIDEETAR